MPTPHRNGESQITKPDIKSKAEISTDISLEKQYGGIHAGSWVSLLPASWVPYVQLARLSPPAALFLIFFPHLFGALHGAAMLHISTSELCQASVTLLGGSFFFSNAAHAWNDLIDTPIDRQIARTKNRPIARGAISPQAASIFTLTQAIGAASFLPALGLTTALATVPTIIGTAYYPWAKRHTHFPQLVLGLCLAWGAVVGSAAIGIEKPWAEPAVLSLVLASTLWTVIYDSVYAHQDVQDDIKIGVKSLAVLCGNYTKIVLWICLLLMGVSLSVYGVLVEASIPFWIISMGGCMLSLGLMIWNVALTDRSSCWWWFSCGFWFTGLSLVAGLLSPLISEFGGLST